MRRTIPKFLTRIICCVLAINLLVAPVVHASWVILDGSAEQSMNQVADMSHRCKQALAEVEVGSAESLPETASAAGESECEHGGTCKVLCSFSASMQHHNGALTNFDKTSHWFSAQSLALKYTFLSRLERPPRL